MALRLKVELGGDGTGFVTMMDKAEKRVDHFGSDVIGPLKGYIAAAFSVGAIESLTRGTIELAGHLRDIADELDVNVEWLQEMQFVMKQNGASADDLEKVIRRIASARAEALSSGGGKQLAAFQKLGIGAQEIQTARITDIVDKIARAFQNGSQQELLPAFQEIGGKAAGKLIPSFLSGLEAGRKAARDAGAVIAEDIIDQVDEIGDSMARAKMEMMADIAPAIIWVTDKFRALLGTIKEVWAGIATFFGSLNWKTLLFGGLKAGNKEVKDAWDSASQAVEGIAQDNAAEDKARKDALDKAMQERANRKSALMQPLEAPKDKFKFGAGTDALAGIGNFLGGSGAASGLVAIGERTNQLLADSNRYLAIIAGKPNAASFNGGGVPEE